MTRPTAPRSAPEPAIPAATDALESGVEGIDLASGNLAPELIGAPRRARPETMTQRVEREMRERAAAGEPEPGIYVCGRCGRDDCRRYLRVVSPEEADATEGLLNQLDGHMHRLPGWDIKGDLLCPCCSFPHLSHCPHRPLDPRCPICDLSTLPTGSLPTGGPFVRCDGVTSHEATP